MMKINYFLIILLLLPLTSALYWSGNGGGNGGNNFYNFFNQNLNTTDNVNFTMVSLDSVPTNEYVHVFPYGIFWSAKNYLGQLSQFGIGVDIVNDFELLGDNLHNFVVRDADLVLEDGCLYFNNPKTVDPFTICNASSGILRFTQPAGGSFAFSGDLIDMTGVGAIQLPSYIDGSVIAGGDVNTTGNVNAVNVSAQCFTFIDGTSQCSASSGTGGAYNISYESTYNSSYLTGYDSNIAWENESNSFARGTKQIQNGSKVIFTNGSTASGYTQGVIMYMGTDIAYTPSTAFYITPEHVQSGNYRVYVGNSSNKFYSWDWAGVVNSVNNPAVLKQQTVASSYYANREASVSVLGNEGGGTSSIVLATGTNGWLMNMFGGSAGSQTSPFKAMGYVNDTTTGSSDRVNFIWDTKTSVFANTNHTSWRVGGVNKMTLDTKGNLATVGNYSSNGKTGKTTSTTVITSVDFLGSVTTSCTLNITGGIINTDSTC